jgi:hypothetical protein
MLFEDPLLHTGKQSPWDTGESLFSSFGKELAGSGIVCQLRHGTKGSIHMPVWTGAKSVMIWVHHWPYMTWLLLS